MGRTNAFLTREYWVRRPASSGLDRSPAGGQSTTHVALDSSRGGGRCSEPPTIACNNLRRPTRPMLATAHSILVAGEILLGNAATRPRSRVVTQLIPRSVAAWVA
ncbi:hypothetical protein TIFTF001_050099 [Ficus carica]|uniref:Uncharacterized protein n=1 Tax=Ficus carica TaxID=3494 RepID=A0AA88CI18_FICCA|nr:hypothetical protein TIFTF001_050099 [Ficus carica]